MDKTYAKKIASVAMLGLATMAVTIDAQAATACGGVATVVSINGGKAVTSPSTTGFFQQGFDLQCSANVFSKYDEVTAGILAVAAISTKGNTPYIGSSNGGAVKDSTKCTGTTCVEGDADTALAAAKLL